MLVTIVGLTLAGFLLVASLIAKKSWLAKFTASSLSTN